MRIKSLQITGFKSFCHSVKFEFIQNGITMVVGPNGCGKSNVADAILWVLGEQSAKHLRGGGMEDVIFAGSDFQKPVGLAEVMLTFDNQAVPGLPRYRDFAEISVSRKLYRSGESVYMINKSPVRLMDVRELIMDTGIGGKSYAIIEQGRVGEIISAKPLDRRYLIEEAAGIVKFKTKRLTAERRLESTQQNLLRVDDLLQELRRQEKGLREQMDKAIRYLDLKNKTRQIDQQLLALKWQRTQRQEKESQTIKNRHQKQQTVLQEKRAAQENRLEQLSSESTLRNAHLETLREEAFQKEREIQESDNKRILERQNIENYEEWLQQQARELEEMQGKDVILRKQQVCAQEETALLEKQFAQLEEEVEQVEQSRQQEGKVLHTLNEATQALQKQLLAIHTRLTNHSNQKGFLQDRLESTSERGIRLEEQRRSNEAYLRETHEKATRTGEKVNRLQTEQEQALQSLQELEAAHADHQRKMAEHERRLQERQYRFQTTTSHLESLRSIQDQYEDLDESVKSFLMLLKKSPAEKKRLGILGVVAEFLNVEASDFAKVAPALVDYLDLLLVEKAAFLPEIERFCQQQEMGRLGFIPLDRAEHFSPPGQLPGIPLSDLLRFVSPRNPALRNPAPRNPAPRNPAPLPDTAVTWLARGFFSRIYLVENQQAWQTRPADETAIEWISPRGSYYARQGIVRIGQPRQSSFGFLKRKSQIEMLTQKASHSQKEMALLQKEKTALEEQHSQRSETIDREKSRQHESDVELSRLHKELEFDQLEHRRTAQLKEQLKADRQQQQQEIEKYEKDRQEIDTKLLHLEKDRKRLEQEMEGHQQSMRAQGESVEKISETLLTTRVKLTEVHQQLKTAEERVQRLSHESMDCRKRMEVLRNSQKEVGEKIKRSRQIIAEIDSRFDSFLQARDALKTRLNQETEIHEQMMEKRSQSSTDLQELTEELERLLTKIHEASLQATEQRIQREQIEEEISNSYSLAPQEMTEQLDLENLDESQLAGQLKKLRARLNEMSHVNQGAPQEHAVLAERVLFVEQQSSDLQKAMNDLRQSIRAINVESRQRFQKTFEQVNQYFKETFTALFEGGEARMVLTDDKDVLEAGIQIIAQPPGKKLQNMNLLSGGEKALTAISLIFAIFLIKPCPFCLLDEVDAPLDDVNVRRFNVMIQQMMKDSQFIIITHNKRTMEIGHRLYGVTMEEPGVSKMVSVEFQEAAGMAN